MESSLIVTESGLLRYLAVTHGIEISRSTIKRMEARKEFPERQLLPFRRLAWKTNDVDAWARKLTGGAA